MNGWIGWMGLWLAASAGAGLGAGSAPGWLGAGALPDELAAADAVVRVLTAQPALAALPVTCAAALGAALALRRSARAKNVIQLNQPGGQVRIHPAAVIELVRRTAAGFRAVRKAAPRVYLKPCGMVIDVVLAVSPGSAVPDLSEKLRTEICRAVARFTGTEPAAVNLIVSHVTGPERGPAPVRR